MANNPTMQYNTILTPDANRRIAQAQQQQEFAKALLSEGMTPVDTNNRSIGGVGYAISPYEGLSKIAQALVGAYGTRKATGDYADVFTKPENGDAPQSTSTLPQQNGSSGDQLPNAPVPQDLPSAQMGGFSPSNIQALGQVLQAQSQPQQQPYSPYSDIGKGLMAGDTGATIRYAVGLLGNAETSRAGAEILSKFAGPTDLQKNAGDPRFGNSIITEQMNKALSPGQSAAQSEAGKAYAGSMPVGALAGMAGMGSPAPAPQAAPQQPVQSSILPVQASQLDAPPSGGIPNPPSPSSFNAPRDASFVKPIPTPNAAPDAGVKTDASPPPDQNYLPAPNPAMTAAQNAANLDIAQKNKIAQDAVATSGDKKAAEDMGANQAATAKDYNIALSTFPGFHSRSVGLQNNALKSSFSPFNSSKGEGIAPFISSVRGGPTADANTYLEKAKEQGLINQMGLQLQQADIGRSKFLGGIIQNADSLDLAKKPKQIVDQVNLNYKNYINNMASAREASIAAGNKNVAPLPMIPMQTRLGPHLIHPEDIDEVLNEGGSFIDMPKTK